MYDVVYILKKDAGTEELRYSLRSVQENFPYRKVWFFCGCPEGFAPDGAVRFEQTGRNKWFRSTSSFRKIIDTPEVSNDFWLFNDDFFILKKNEAQPYMYRGRLEDRVADLRTKYTVSGYTNSLAATIETLEKAGLATLDYAMHVPMLINKARAAEVLDAFPDCPMFRSLYGNYWKVGGVQSHDFKIYDRESRVPEDWPLCSTTDDSFKYGAVGEYIRSAFTKRSKWEVQNENL